MYLILAILLYRTVGTVPLLCRLFDLSSGQHLLDLGGELRNGAGQLDLAWLDHRATFLACGYDTCTRLWDTRCHTYVRTWEEPYDESGGYTFFMPEYWIRIPGGGI